MNILIDGYNLIFDIGLISDRESKERFEKARRRLIRELASRLSEFEGRQTLIVFDAANAPPGLPDSFEEEHIGVRFAAGYAEADDLIEELIKQHSAPKQLLVVSSDHRLKRAAAARKAKSIDCQIWFDGIRPHQPKSNSPPESETQTPAGITEEEHQAWLDEFETPAENTTEADVSTSADNPFPPGYADDLFEEE